MRYRLEMLQALARRNGIEARPVGKRGEVILTFPNPVREGGPSLELRLSYHKAWLLTFWIDLKLRKEEEGGESHG